MSGLRISPHAKAHILKGRATVRPPAPDEAAAVAAVARETQGRRTREGIPLDVIVTLEAVRQLAEQGNLAAKWLYDQERARLGIDRPIVSTTSDPG